MLSRKKTQIESLAYYIRMLLPFNGLPRPEDKEIDHKRPQQEHIPTSEIEPTYSDSSLDSSSEDDNGQQQKEHARKDILARRGTVSSSTTITDQLPLRRGQRRCAPPRWMQQDDWDFDNQTHVINVNAKELVYN